MAAPNIVNVTSIYGKTATVDILDTNVTLVENATSSGKVFKINSLIVSNIDGYNASDVNIYLSRQAGDYFFAYGITVPPKSTLTVIGKDSMIYLEEGDLIITYANPGNSLQAICSYEEIS